MNQKLVIGIAALVVIIIVAAVLVGTRSSAPAQTQSTTAISTAPPTTIQVISNGTNTTGRNTTGTNLTSGTNYSKGINQSTYSVNIATNGTVEGGMYLVNSTGWTLYLYTVDTPNSGASSCYGGCATAWPPFYAGSTLNLPSGLNQSDFGTITRTGGALQTTYKGWPLYYYAGDKAAGEINGQGVGGNWYVVTTPTIYYIV